MSISYCPFCGTQVTCCDREEHGGPKPCCTKCGVLFLEETRHKFVWFQKEVKNE